MKNINKVLSIGVLFIVFMLTSCSEEVINREESPLQNPNSTNVYFVNDSNHVIGKDSTSFEVKIKREKYEAAQEVKLNFYSSAADLFTVPSTVSFAAGDSMQTLKIDVGNIKMMKIYHLTLEVDDDQANLYKAQENYSRVELHLVKEDYEKFASGVYKSEFFEQEWNATLQYSPSMSIYRFKNCWVEGYDFTFKVEEKDGKIIQSPETQPSGYVHSKYGMVSVTADPEESKYDEATQTYTFVIKWTVGAGSFGVFNDTFVVKK